MKAALCLAFIGVCAGLYNSYMSLNMFSKCLDPDQARKNVLFTVSL